MLNVVMLSVVMLSVVMQNVTMLSVVAPLKGMERPVRAKRFSLLRKFVNYVRKKFYNVGTRSNGSESLSGGRDPRDDGVAASSKTPESPATDSVLTADEDTCANVLNYNKLVRFQFKN